ncbi:VOC family protein [Prosthecodimorpha staleyi]|uniref:VOC family protein n=1 Tax=Prosthecodimorpha staleyi TaxID=2840188 RepID=A0A947DAW6_9HYPH|nr:VOC family protein [Prosthecodimorpha staleyi]MBT9291957.1 VOC family protein [Prosthecodimorpha staleyi]
MRMIFVNLPVKDLNASKAFFQALGFTFNPQFTNDEAACMVIAENHVYAMLLTEPRFRDFITGEIADAERVKEVLNALSCASREEVTDLKARALAAGGREWKPDMDHGFMVGASFQDLDGHVWELIWMDPAHIQ